MVHRQLRFGRHKIHPGLVVKNSRGERFVVTSFGERYWKKNGEEDIRITLKKKR